MGRFFEIIYWALAALLMSLIFMSVMGTFGAALFLSVMLMPGILFVKYFQKDISFSDRRKGITDMVYLSLTALVIEYYAVVFVYWNIYQYDFPDDGGILVNPFFILFLVASLLVTEKFLESKFASGEHGRDKFVTFISERKKISLPADSITHIESRDTEVLVWTAGGVSYQTRMKISQWETVLDNRFVRVHRSFIVNRGHVKSFDSRTIRLDNAAIEVSRKYKEKAVMELSAIPSRPD